MHKKEFFFSINHMFEWYHPIKIIDYMQIHNLVYREGILNHLRTDAQTFNLNTNYLQPLLKKNFDS